MHNLVARNESISPGPRLLFLIRNNVTITWMRAILRLNKAKYLVLVKVAQWGYARSRSARQRPQSKVYILVLFAVILIKTTET